MLLSLLAAACGGGGGSAVESTTKGPNPPVAQGNDGSRAGGVSGGTTNGGTTTLPGDTVPALQGPPVIRQAQLNITVGSGKFGSKLSEVRALVEGQGGYIAGTDAQAKPFGTDQSGPIRTGVINFMVPAAHFDATIDELAKIGDVQGEHITGTDVSAQYVDLRARLANAEAQRNAMLALLSGAKTINDIIAVQNQIGQITGQIEQLKGQIKYLDDNTSYSSVSGHAHGSRRPRADRLQRQLGLRHGAERRRAQLRRHDQLRHHRARRGRSAGRASRPGIPSLAPPAHHAVLAAPRISDTQRGPDDNPASSSRPGEIAVVGWIPIDLQ